MIVMLSCNNSFHLQFEEFYIRMFVLLWLKLCSFFKQLCSKVLKTNQLEYIEKDIIVTLCKLERIIPPSFFDVIVHLPIHLASEAKVTGLVQDQWMYPIERFVLIQLILYILGFI